MTIDAKANIHFYLVFIIWSSNIGGKRNDWIIETNHGVPDPNILVR